MTVKEMKQELEKFHDDAEIVLTSCDSSDCNMGDGDCDENTCHWIRYDIQYVGLEEKNQEDEFNSKHDYPRIHIMPVDSWDFEKGEIVEIKEN